MWLSLRTFFDRAAYCGGFKSEQLAHPHKAARLVRLVIHPALRCNLKVKSQLLLRTQIKPAKLMRSRSLNDVANRLLKHRKPNS